MRFLTECIGEDVDATTNHDEKDDADGDEDDDEDGDEDGMFPDRLHTWDKSNAE